MLLKIKIPIVVVFFIFINFAFQHLFAYETSDILDFMQAGKTAFENKKFSEAAIEFENILMLDPEHLDAKIWLIKTYIALKNRKKAQDILKLAKLQDPTNPEILSLEKEIGKESTKASKKEADPVVQEALTLLGRKQSQRPYGFVIPESKVKKPQDNTKKTNENMETDDDLLKEAEPPPKLDENKTYDEGPLYEVFDAWALEGLNAGLEKYFELISRNRSLSMLSDKNLLAEGEKFYKPRLAANPNDEEAIYYLGMITYFNGDVIKARDMLEPLRNSKWTKSPGARWVFAHFDKIRAAEEAYALAKKKAEEEAEAARRAQEQAKAEAEAAKAAAEASADVASGTEKPTEGTPEALDAEGYDMYKKGQLEAAIAKFQEAIQKNSGEPKFHYHLGLALTDKALAGELQAFDKAIEAFNQVIRLSPGSKLAREAEIMIRDITAAKNSIR